MMNVLLRVDHREPPALKQELKQSFQNIEFLNLQAGDFEFLDSNTGETLLLIERKEIEDLCSSLTDGRFDEQKTKLSSTINEKNPHSIAYIIEGDYSGHEKTSAINTVMMTTRFRDGFFLLRTQNIHDTASTVHRIADLFSKNKMKPLSQDELHRRFIASRSAHRSSGQFSKKDQWWTISLGQIPGIGPGAARAIAMQYPTVRSLLDAYNRCKSVKKRGELLQDLTIGSGSTRRLGPSASEKVWRCIVGDGDDRRPYAPRQPPTSKRQYPKKERKIENLSECMFVDEDE